MRRILSCAALLIVVVFLIANAFAQGSDSAGSMIRELCEIGF